MSEVNGSVLTGNPESGNPAANPSPAPEDGTPPVTVTASGVNTDPPPDTGWLDALPEELKGFAQNKAWKSPEHAVESYRNLEKMMGQKTRAVPADDDAAGWEKFYNDMGRPEKPADYKFDLPSEYNPDLVDFFSNAAHKVGLSKKQADAFLEQYLDFENAFRVERGKQQDTRVAAAQGELRQEWGAKYDENINLAARGAKAVGLEQAEQLALEDAMGQAQFAKVFQRIGLALCGEDNTPNNVQGGRGFGVLTPAAAQARVDELFSRPDYMQAYLAGDKAKKDEITALYEQIAAGRGQGK